jgi:hypothetical protein
MVEKVDLLAECQVQVKYKVWATLCMYQLLREDGGKT